MKEAAAQVYSAAGMKPADVDVLGITDSHTPAVIHTLENYGFCGEGEAGAFVGAGEIELGGSIPTNTDGGAQSGGYLLGWPSQAELVRQLRGEGGERQVRDATVGQYCTTGRVREDYLSIIYTVE
jgi:acetyl-CoA acetyltransferase